MNASRFEVVASRASAAPPIPAPPPDGTLRTIGPESLPPAREWRALVAASQTLDELIAVRDQARSDCRRLSGAYLLLHRHAPVRQVVKARFEQLQRELALINDEVKRRHDEGETVKREYPPVRRTPKTQRPVSSATADPDQPCPSCGEMALAQRQRKTVLFYCQACGTDWSCSD